MEVQIREACTDDAAAIVAVLNPIILARTYTALDTTLTVEAEREFIERFPERGVFLVAVRESDQRVVGFQDLEPFSFHTHAFDHVGVIGTYVDLALRRQGISKRLFRTMFEVAGRKGYGKICTYVRAGNDAALRTYRHQGFTIVGTAYRHAKIDGRYIDEIVIERPLDLAASRPVDRG